MADRRNRDRSGLPLFSRIPGIVAIPPQIPATTKKSRAAIDRPAIRRMITASTIP